MLSDRIPRPSVAGQREESIPELLLMNKSIDRISYIIITFRKIIPCSIAILIVNKTRKDSKIFLPLKYAVIKLIMRRQKDIM